MEHNAQAGKDAGKKVLGLTLAALGVVYGDIGTSPLYTLQTCLSKEYGVVATPANVLGILSLIMWALLLIVSLKYAIFIMRSDNRGEGGILALLALALRGKEVTPRLAWLFGVVGIFGAALFYGDGMVTPAISVLSAVEGLEIVSASFKPYVLPITIAVLIALFCIQRKGTARVGVYFGPVMLVWFLCIAVLGLRQVVQHPAVFAALNPAHALAFAVHHGTQAFIILGAVVLSVTGAEALYADMGHFGRTPIRLSWFWFVFPSLVLNYLGQGALVIDNPALASNPFFHMVPDWGQLPMVALSTVATVIASQAVISGAFSLSRQAIQLRYLPRMDIRHTSEREIGQIYVPMINWLQLAAVIALVLGFGSSTSLASAYGIAVTGTMVCTTYLALVVAHKRWRWNWPLTIVVGVFFMSIDLAFFGANTLKIAQGGWFPLLVGLVVFTLMTTWEHGRRLLAAKIRAESMPLDIFLASIAGHGPERVPGTSVFLTGNQEIVPAALLHNLKHNKVMHERVVLLTIGSRDIPRVADEERVEIRELGGGFHSLHAHYGFQETPNIPDLLAFCAGQGLAFDMMDTSFFLSRETVIPSRNAEGMLLWRERLFAWMSRNAMSAATFFGLPMNRVIELGAQIEI